MSEESKCNCQHCGGHIAFPSEAAGQDVACPHCGGETTLVLPQVRKVNPDSNALVPRDELKSEMPDATKVLIGIIGIAIVAISLALIVHHQNEAAQAERNWKEAITPRTSYTEQVEEEQVAREKHQDYIHWEATNGIAEGEFVYATNLLSSQMPTLTNTAIEWLQKAADQGYQPAIELLGENQPKSQLDSIDNFLWENRGTDLSETENDLTSTYNPAVFNGERYMIYDRSITIANGKIVLKAEDKIHNDDNQELTDLTSKEAANNKIDFEIGKEAQITPIFEKFLEWAATAKENNVENFQKQIICVTNSFGGTLGSAQAIRTYTFSWQDGQANLIVSDSSRDSVAGFSTEDVFSYQKLLLRLPQMKQKLADAIRNKEAQKNLFH